MSLIHIVLGAVLALSIALVVTGSLLLLSEDPEAVVDAVGHLKPGWWPR